MSKHKNLKRNLLICLLTGSSVMYTLPLYAATSVVGNNTLPSGGQFFDGGKFTQGTANANGNGFDFAGIGSITKPDDLTMNVHQNNQNAVIKWGSFDVGGSATVNFTAADAFKNNFNTLNYVNSGSASQIYGTINGLGGNIYVVNTAGVQIGPSAQINVGSLYVSNNVLDDSVFNDFVTNANNANFDLGGKPTTYTDAALMSLGNINANNVTFEGNGRIVIDSERLINGNNSMGAANINIETAASNTGNIVIGYDGYDETTNSYNTAGTTAIAKVNGQDFAQNKGYMWVEDVEQLQAIGKNAESLTGNYALRNSIDATGTEQSGFNPIGLNNYGKVIINNEGKYGFSGKFDGIDYNIFGLNINQPDETNVGLFGVAHDANINNVTLVGGSITGGSVVGSVVGAALGNTHITNATNSASVTGNTDVGGIVGYSGDEISDGDNGNIIVNDTDSHFANLVNTGTVHSKGEESNENGGIVSNAGGLIGYMYNGKLDGNSYNLGDVSGKGYNVGGLVGHAVNSTIGDGTNLVYNRLDVEGAYNVGGIVGNMKGSTVQNAENSGTVEATGYTTEVYKYHTADNSYDIMAGKDDDDIAEVEVAVANVGGIVGTSSSSDNGSKSAIINVENSGDISSSKNSNNEFYDAGNIGGIIGRANNTDITSATNRENEIRGAHNIGGVAGYLGGNSTVSGGINDGGDIMATGARAAANSSYNVADGPGAGDNNYYGSNVNNNGFALEHVRNGNTGRETFIIGNMGGIVGYMEGKDAKITGSANRGTVHTFDEFEGTVPDYAKAANAGGVVGKIDRVDTLALADLQGKDENNNDKILKAAVSNSYNTGDVMGYSNVGGIAGMMYNGEVAGSYNLGYISTTRQPGKVGGEGYDALNMGGIVGDTTEGTEAEALLYDVYNKGKIGDSTYTYYGRHVAGIVGRLSGDVEKAYNNGAIYNAYAATGGIVGWMYKGSINNAFNTGNITVYNRDSSTSQVGGIVGAVNVGSEEINLTNLYNLGTLRSFKRGNGNNAVGGIVGAIMNYQHNINISNAYTTGNIYVDDYSGNLVKSIYGEVRGAREFDGGQLHYPTVNTENTYYIQPDTNLGVFDNLHDKNNKDNDRDNSNKAIDFNQKHLHEQYQYDDKNGHHSLTFTQQSGGDVDGGSDEIASDNNWRIYAGNTPILNAFLPDAEGYFSQKGNMAGIGSIQYGTAYDPLLTIINAANDTNQLKYEWDKLGISNAAGLVVYGAGLTLDNVNTSSGSGYFGGTIYADGALNLNGGTNDIGLGSAADIYGSAVNITTGGKVTIYGDVTATGNTANGATSDTSDVIDVKDKGNITISASDVDVYGTLTSASNNTQDATVKIPGIQDSAVTWTPGEVNNPNAEMADIADRFAHTIGASAVDGNITINAKGTPADVDGDGTIETDEVIGGNVNLYYGNKGEGITTTGGNLSVIGTGDVYVDSDLDIGGDLMLEGTGADSEVVLDITNIGQVQDKNDNTDKDNSTDYLHDFLEHFANTTNNSISFGDTQDAKITVDMWNGNTLDLTKFNNGSTSLVEQLGKLKIANAENKTAQQLTHIWISNGEQLNGIQKAANSNYDVLGYNFALKNDINASDIGNDYEAIGGTTGYNGTFDGRGNRIIGLKVENANGNAGIFDTIGTNGVVKDVNIYSGTFTGSSNAGAVAGVNNGRIEGIVTFGNTVTVTGNGGNAGGIAGTNSGTVDDVESTGSVIAGGSNAQNFAGGLVGTNNITGIVNNSFSNSAVTASSGSTDALGGVVGVNSGEVSLVDSLGITNGGAHYIGNVGGIIGTNSGKLNSAYNESIVSGYSNVGGIIGNNSGTISNIVNASSVDGLDINPDVQQAQSNYVGGLVGSNSGSVTNGRNNGTITGTNYVGGMVGSNAQGATLTNLVNDSSAAIEGEQYVGGIAGSNAGKISATDDTLINRGSITGNKFVGGVAGVNEEGGTIENTISNIDLNVKTPYTDDNNSDNDPAFFGGVVGQNSGTVIGANNQSSVDVAADGATYVGGIIGQNTSTGTLEGKIRNGGTVSGLSNVGGIIGENKNANLLNNDNNERLEITNTGSVRATQGGAAGIFYSNNITGTEGDTNANAINNVDITNSGTVTGGTDEKSVTGGLFGINSGNITNSTLTNTGVVTGGGTVGGLIGTNSGSAKDSTFTNSGTVSGNTNVGGLFGTNSGKFERSSLINTVNGQVSGTNNVGGLIGYNTGEIIGGRKDVNGTDVGYYKYQIYNNGVITIKGNGSNIGGLIGDNQGSLTAGYNTGAINASGSTNVGGIAGSNSGKIDQVFNTVMVKPGSNQDDAIEGGKNVGGLVGENTNNGTLSNAYNTTKVVGTLDNAVVGNAVGENQGTITNIYATNTSGRLIGYANGTITHAYSFSSADSESRSATYISGDADTDNDDITDRLDGDSYGGFDFSTTDGDAADWKNYDGSGNPLLKVFLTTVNVDADELPDLVYNTEDQKLNIDDLTGENGAFSADDDFTAYNNNTSLIQNTDFIHKNAGTYDNWLYSEQIAASGRGETFNPNNLGYDIELTHDIDKAQITVDLNEVERTYGDTTILNNGNYNYSYDFANVTNETDLANLRNELNNKDVLLLGNVDKTKDDGGLVEDGTKTNNAGDYNWTGTVNIADGYQGNYEFVLTTEQSNDNQSSLGTNGTSITTIGDSIVNAKTITLGDFLATIVYGNQNNEFTYSGYEDWLEDQLVYGDHIGLSFSGATTGGAYETDKGNRDTADVGTYTDSITANVALTNNEKGNYVIESGSVTGDILVTPAQLDIELGDVSHVYGRPNLDDYEASFGTANGLVNGDSGSISVNVDSVTDGALSTDKRYTDDVGNYYWTVGEGGLNANGFSLGNYTINYVNQGDSEVTKANLTININDVNMTYGDLESWISGQYGYNASDVDGQKLVNGDSLADVIAGMTYNNTAYNSDGTTKNVADGNFALTSDGVTQGTKYGNYNITFNNGTVTMDKKQITIGANDEQILVGETPNYSGTDIDSVLVNGDSLNGNYHYGVADGTIENVAGTHTGVIGVWIGGVFYDLSQNVDWTQAGSFFSNYEVNYTPGTLTVSAYDIPEDWPHNRWDYLFNDAPFDRNKDFRERKAEVNFVDGGMEI